MNRKWISAAIAASVVVFAIGATALAGNYQKPTATCPECGAEFELDMPERVGRPERPCLSEEEMQAQLDERVAAGELTQEEADQKLADWKARMEEMEQHRQEMEQRWEETPDSRSGRGRFGRAGGGRPFDCPRGETPQPPETEDAPEA